MSRADEDENIASVLALIESARYLAANDAYAQIMRRQAGGTDAREAARQAVVTRLSEDSAIQTMLERCREIERCLQVRPLSTAHAVYSLCCCSRLTTLPFP
jgi:hypothetical protein